MFSLLLITYIRPSYGFKDKSALSGRQTSQGLFIRHKENRINKNKLFIKYGFAHVKFYKSISVYYFSWKKKKSIQNANNICKDILEDESIILCEVNKSPDPARFSNLIYPCNSLEKSEPLNLSSELTALSDCELYTGQKSLNSEFSHIPTGLTPFWSQEYIGADLARLDFPRINNPNIDDIFFLSIFDSTRNSHGEQVESLISHDEGQAVVGQIEREFVDLTDNQLNAHYLNALERYESRGQYPRFINNSMSWGSVVVQEAVEKMIDSGTVFITAAGNHGQRVSDQEPEKVESIESHDLIIVGNIGSTGAPAAKTNFGPGELTILAPSDNNITSYQNEGFSSFGGTSAAAPLVTGAILAFELNSEMDLTQEQANLLLRNTAIKIYTPFNSQEESIFGAGMLNSYKIAAIAERLREQCKGDSTCLSQALEKKETYQFPLIDLTSEIESSFPTCLDNNNSLSVSSLSNCRKKEVMNLIRRQALLNPTNVQNWTILSCVYDSVGLSQNATFYQSISRAITSSYSSNDLSYSFFNDPADRARYISLNPTSQELIQALGDSNNNVRQNAMIKLSSLPINEVIPIAEQALQQISDINTYNSIQNQMLDNFPNSANAIVAGFLNENIDLFLRSYLFKNLVKEAGTESTPYLIEILRRSNFETKMEFIDVISENLQREQIVEVLKKVEEDPNEEIRNRVKDILSTL